MADQEITMDSDPPSKRLKQEDLQQPSTTISLYDPPPTNDYNTPNDDQIRTSSLSSPTLKLTGHKSSVYSLSYSPLDGEYLVSSSFDMTCLVWNASSSVHTGGTANYDNVSILKGHKNAILDVSFSQIDRCGDFIITGSADKTCGWWDTYTATRLKRFLGHEDIINAVDVPKVGTSGGNNEMVVSGSDDTTVRIWDARNNTKDCCVGVLEHDWAVTSVVFGMDGHTVYSAGIDNLINAWDIRAGLGSGSNGGKKRNRGGDGEYGSMTMRMKGHTDTITSLALHPKGTHLLSNSMDGTLKTWDIRPFMDDDINKKRHCKTFKGGTHNAEKGLLNCAWSSDGTMVTGGSADKVVHIWDELTEEELYYLPGHTGCVNSVIFHPKENVIASASSDKTIYVGELSS